MTTPIDRRARKRRDALRAMGLRPLQIWVPDARQPECRRQASLVAATDAADAGLDDFMDAALADATQADE